MTQARQREGRRPAFWTAALSALVLPVLVLALLMPLGGCSRLAGARSRAPERAPALPATAPTGRLQEVAPPAGVRQLSTALAVHRPRLRITAPDPGRVLGSGPWRLALQVDDWPLVNAGTLGLGPHLVVQVDRRPPLRISDWSSGDPATGRLEVELPELDPGSHQISVYAARPWGEAVKGPGASAQLLVHRLSADPLSLPAPDSPRLLPVSPAALAAAEPVLIDWLLDNAPLQGLREGDGQWRLRITINGDSFLVDQNTPLWLKGFRNGSNAVLLELLDGLGEPLNPPFNSAVREVVIDPTARRPAWLQARLSDTELAQLLGQLPLEPATSEAEDEEPASSTPARERAASQPAATGGEATRPADAEPAETEEATPTTAEPITPQPAASGPAQPPAAARAAMALPAAPTPVPTPAPTAEQASGVAPPATLAGEQPPAEAPAPADVPASAVQAPAVQTPATTPAPATGKPAGGVAPATGAAMGAAPPERITAGSSLQGSAREQVRDDGSLIQPPSEGPFSALRNRLQGQRGEA